jgi:hypothetical protein
MNLPKVLLPPIVSLALLFVVIYGLGSCMADIPDEYRPKRLAENGLFPEKIITMYVPGDASPRTIALFSWGARFREGDESLGALKYERVYYTLRDRRGAVIWKMTSHDTYVLVADAAGTKLFTVNRERDRVIFVDPDGKVLCTISLADGAASLLAADGALIARAAPTESGAELTDPSGATLLTIDPRISPAGLCCFALSEYDPLERAALMVMVK